MKDNEEHDPFTVAGIPRYILVQVQSSKYQVARLQGGTILGGIVYKPVSGKQPLLTAAHQLKVMDAQEMASEQVKSEMPAPESE